MEKSDEIIKKKNFYRDFSYGHMKFTMIIFQLQPIHYHCWALCVVCMLVTLGVHAQQGLQYLVYVSVCLLLNISLFTQTILTSAADEGRKF